MTDEVLPERDEVASAYLDGELQADDRARAEADPQTMTLVETLRSQRTSLADVPAASMSDRAAALQAALSEYDALAPMRRLTPLSELEPRRRRNNRWVLAAAAAVIVVIAVVAVVASGGSDKGTQTADRSTNSVANAPASTKVGAPTTTAAAGGAEATQPSTNAAGGGGSNDPGTPTPINSPAALRQFAQTAPAFATDAAGTAVVSAAPAVSGPACLPAGDTVLGYITFLNIPAYAVQDTATGSIKALAATDCRQLISVSP